MGKSGLFVSILNLTNSVTGAAFLALPFQVTLLGQVGVALFLILFFVLNYVTLEMLSSVYRHNKEHFPQTPPQQQPQNLEEINNNNNNKTKMKTKLKKFLAFPTINNNENVLFGKAGDEESNQVHPPTAITSEPVYDVKEMHDLLSCYGNGGVVVMYHIAIILSMFGSLCVLVIVARTCLYSLVLAYSPETSPILFDSVFVSSFAVLVFLPTLVKKISSQWAFSFVSLLSLLYIFVSVIVRGSQVIAEKGYPPYIQPPFTLSALSCLGVAAFSMTCQMNAVPIFDELENPTEWRLRILNLSSLSLSTVIYLFICNFGFYSQGVLTNPNIILGFPLTDPVMQAAKVFLALKMLFTFPLFAHPLLASVDDILRRAISIRQDSRSLYWARRVPVAASFVIGSVLIGYFFDDISPVLSLTGAIADSFISFLFPSLLLMHWILRSLGGKEQLSLADEHEMTERYQRASSLVLVSIIISGLTVFGLLSGPIS